MAPFPLFFRLLPPGKSGFCRFRGIQRQTARRLPEANAGCLSRNRRLFDERKAVSQRCHFSTSNTGEPVAGGMPLVVCVSLLKKTGLVFQPESPFVSHRLPQSEVVTVAFFALSWAVAGDVAAVVTFVLEVQVCAADDFALASTSQCVVVGLVDRSQLRSPGLQVLR
jgi:hypothetical protein